jgi:hypothetical protein
MGVLRFYLFVCPLLVGNKKTLPTLPGSLPGSPIIVPDEFDSDPGFSFSSKN